MGLAVGRSLCVSLGLHWSLICFCSVDLVRIGLEAFVLRRRDDLRLAVSLLFVDLLAVVVLVVGVVIIKALG